MLPTPGQKGLFGVCLNGGSPLERRIGRSVGVDIRSLRLAARSADLFTLKHSADGAAETVIYLRWLAQQYEEIGSSLGQLTLLAEERARLVEAVQQA